MINTNQVVSFRIGVKEKVNYSTNEDDFVITDEVKGISINNSDLSITTFDNKQSGKLELFTTLSRRKNIIMC